MARRKPNPGSTLFLRLKIGAVSVLALTFIGVWAPVLMGTSAGGASPDQAAVIQPGDGPPPAASEEPAAPSSIAVEPWPVMTLEQATAFDPLAEPPWAARRRIALEASQSRPAADSQVQDPELALKTIRDAGASMVIIAGTQKSAMVGKRSIRVGDLVNGFPVVDIDSSGVVLGEYLGAPAEEVSEDNESN